VGAGELCLVPVSSCCVIDFPAFLCLSFSPNPHTLKSHFTMNESNTSKSLLQAQPNQIVLEGNHSNEEAGLGSVQAIVTSHNRLQVALGQNVQNIVVHPPPEDEEPPEWFDAGSGVKQHRLTLPSTESTHASVRGVNMQPGTPVSTDRTNTAIEGTRARPPIPRTTTTTTRI